MSEALRTNFESDEEGRCTPSPEPESKKKRTSPAEPMRSELMKGNEADYGHFVIDRTESITLDAADVARMDSTSTEDSSSWMEKVLSNVMTSQEKENGCLASKNPTPRNNGCFNCDGSHHLNECPEPKDIKRIRRRQSELRNRGNTPRYHNDEGPAEKKFRPGRISDELRVALGIGKNDIPEYIYRMRRKGFLAGYPPGYLKKAIERDETKQILKFLMEDDKNSLVEDSEPPDSPPPIIIPNKVIYYCGFNQTYRDLRDYENFRVPPFHEFVAYHQHALNRLHEKKVEERRRMRDRTARQAKKRTQEVLEDGEIVILEPPPPPPPNVDDDVIVLDYEPTKTPSPPLNSPESCDTPKGFSIGAMMGTPVLTRRGKEGKHIVDDSKPTLDSFSKGIVPFEAAEENTPHKGFLKKIMGKLKKFAR